MTPYEISEPVLDIIFNDMENDGYFTEEVMSNFTIMEIILPSLIQRTGIIKKCAFAV